MGYILAGSLTRLKTLVYEINGAEYIEVYIKHNGELNPGVVPYMQFLCCEARWQPPNRLDRICSKFRPG